eukprot:gb/GEZN01014620.1/.p1 GENE.gb/GEZN01014620.1/~~gb/GEZN01014620.1/.p1  ORF type:complete len:161 (-),score=46.74 gb/GEZN01014620.1/:145-627(-)
MGGKRKRKALLQAVPRQDKLVAPGVAPGMSDLTEHLEQQERPNKQQPQPKKKKHKKLLDKNEDLLRILNGVTHSLERKQFEQTQKAKQKAEREKQHRKIKQEKRHKLKLQKKLALAAVKFTGEESKESMPRVSHELGTTAASPKRNGKNKKGSVQFSLGS